MTTYTVFSQQATGTTLTSDALPYTLGMQFSVNQGCTMTAVWFYSASGASVLPQTIALYQVTGNSLVHSESASWSGAAGSGWVRAAFASPPSLLSSTQYKVCVLQNTSVNWYSSTSNYWTTGAGQNGLTNGPITAPNNTNASPGQDSYTQSNLLAYPSATFGGSNYWVDVEVSVSSGVTGQVSNVNAAAVYGGHNPLGITASVSVHAPMGSAFIRFNIANYDAVPGFNTPGLLRPGFMSTGNKSFAGITARNIISSSTGTIKTSLSLSCGVQARSIILPGSTLGPIKFWKFSLRNNSKLTLY